MKIICAPDSFKESLSAAEAARRMAAGVRDARPDAQTDLCPISDGGEGFVEAMRVAMAGKRMVSTVRGPLGEPVEAAWALLEASEDGSPRTAVIEMAAASGLELVPPDRRDPTKTTTFGTGELIREAVAEHGCRRVLVGIGGSATCDGGCGMAQAVGVAFFGDGGTPIDEPIAGGMLARLSRFEIEPARERTPGLDETEIVVACDVTNPLTGEHGAAHVYGPQKGASEVQVAELDGGLRRLAALSRERLGIDIEPMRGAGAAGGLGGGLVAFLGATLRPGIGLVLDAVRFDERVGGCGLCLTGEGKLDGQSLSGKACLGVARAAAARGVPTVALVGALGEAVERTLDAGLRAYHVIGEGLPREESMRRAGELLQKKTAEVVRAWV